MGLSFSSLQKKHDRHVQLPSTMKIAQINLELFNDGIGFLQATGDVLANSWTEYPWWLSPFHHDGGQH